MRTRSFVAFAFVGLAAVAAVMVACSDDNIPTCKQDTLQIEVELDGTANYADTIQISVDEPSFTQTAAHTPNGNLLQYIDLTFPGGYPVDKVVTVKVTAIGGTTVLGENVFSVHLLKQCSTAFVPIHGGGFLPVDGGQSD
jgi:hypothetical protein